MIPAYQLGENTPSGPRYKSLIVAALFFCERFQMFEYCTVMYCQYWYQWSDLDLNPDPHPSYRYR